MSSNHVSDYNHNYYLKNKEKLNAQSKKYQLENKEKIKAQKAKQYQKNKQKKLEQNKKYYNKNREAIRKQQAEYHQKNKDKIIKYNKDWYEKKGWKNKTQIYLKAKQEVIDLLGGKCAKCGFTDIRALQIDHINGNGCQESRKIGYYGIRNRILAGQTKEYQVLCANCNWIKRYENDELGRYKKNRIKDLKKNKGFNCNLDP